MEPFPIETARILLIDDEILVRRVLNKRLVKEGYHCREANNGAEALSMLSEQPADLVIMDIRMPVKTGLETLPVIRSEFPDTAVIMATAVSDIGTAVQCMKNGAKDYITKPFNLDEVVANVEKALHTRKLEIRLKDYQSALEQELKRTKADGESPTTS
jgi:putative two-component system response regulator